MSKAPRRLRAYALTQGRTHTDTNLPIDAMITVAEIILPDTISPEQAIIVAACNEGPQSLADLSARLETPVGVVRVLLGDLIRGGTVDVSSTDDRVVAIQHDLALLEEVLNGIESL